VDSLRSGALRTADARVGLQFVRFTCQIIPSASALIVLAHSDLEGNDAGDNVSLSQQGLSQIEIVEDIFQSTQLAMDDVETNEMFAGEDKHSPHEQEQEFDSEIWFE
jgi:hypothetical protein